ncbi:CENP-B homolog protein 2-like [Rhizophagus clarus]|uniref:CENP-B homolog protein 2-like n=1 Tax=Rhizophagus clarus TaxID=94130 RepID=A0A8H3M202_9GLOM|nr:CENP-B homolog protein 2-like [Rhizophagus clarus]
MSPNQTLSIKPIFSQKKDKIRITVFLSTNIIGTDKLMLWVTGYDNNANGKEVTQLKLIHVEVAFLLPNTTNHLQPLDAEVIKSFKAHYK